MLDDLSYDAVAQTRIHSMTWDRATDGYRRFERSTPIGHGARDWDAASTQVLRWAVKTRSGFAVRSSSGRPGVVEGDDYVLVARIGPLRLREPVRVVDVVQQHSVCGFAYGTRAGHPVSGEEAFIVRRDADGTVWLTLRSLTRAASGWRRVLFPLALIAQPFYRRRYLTALP